MKPKNVKKILVSLFLIILLLTVTTNNKLIYGKFVAPAGKVTVSTKERNVVQGLKETEIIFKDNDGQNQVKGHALEIDVKNKNIGFLASYKDYDSTPGSWGYQTVRNQAKAAEQKTGKNIVAGINTSFYNMGTGEPLGLQVMNGVTKQTPNEGFPYFFGVLKNGKPIIENTKYYNENKDEIKEASAGHVLLVENGKANVFNDEVLMPRIGIGIKADGSVILYSANGRDFPHSVGLTLDELAQTMVGLGAVTAINMDGGGSATYVSKVEGQEGLQLISKPSDGGGERTVSSALLIYSDAGYDGEFHHANISPNNELFTPNTEINFNAIGVDGGGGSATLPAGLEYVLADESKHLGEISYDGNFLSNGTLGEVKILLKDLQGKVVGESINQIVVPNEIEFFTSELSLGFDKRTDLGLSVTHNGRVVNIKDGDILFDFDPDLGRIEDNIFISSDENTKTGYLKAKLAHNENLEASIFLNVGQLPEVLFDFETTNENEEWITNTVGRGEVGSSEIVHHSSGEPVWSGEHSLKINFDYRNAQTGTTLGVYTGLASDQDYVFPGQPTGVGMWVYGTEESQGLWLRSRLTDGSGSQLNLNFTEENVGINWLGWKYVEIPLEGFVGPFTIFRDTDANTYELIRLMMLRSGSPTSMGKMVEGSIYVDNIRAVYGANVDDLKVPIIESIEVDGENINNQTINTNVVNIKTTFTDDLTDKYASGINYERVDIYVDGVNFRDREGIYSVDESKDEAMLNQIKLSDGIHQIKVVIRDNFGNVTEEVRYLTVDTNSSRYVTYEENLEALLGQDYSLAIKSSDIEGIKTFTTILRLSRTLEDYEYTINSDFEGFVNYKEETRELLITLSRKEGIIDASTDEIIFEIVFSINENLSHNDNINYQVIYGQIEYLDGEIGSFSKAPTNKPVVSNVLLETEVILLGEEETIIKVKDKDGNYIEGADVFSLENDNYVLLGSTDKNGELILNDFADNIRRLVLRAEYNNEVSFNMITQILNIDGELSGEPSNITLNSNEFGNTGVSVGWLSNPLADNKEALINYALKSDYLVNGNSTNFKEVSGLSKVFAIQGSENLENNFGVRINSVQVGSLKEDETYVYKVGNGTVWSEIREFKTGYNNSDLSFAIMGDLQTSDYDRFTDILSKIENGLDYDFVIQTGDYIDNPTNYNYLNGTTQTVSDTWLGNVPMLHTLGNHEYMGDSNGSIMASYFNLPTKDNDNSRYYSIDYGLLYVAVISYANDVESISEALNWLEEDSANSDARWKILVTHNPIYYTNPAGGNGLFLEMAPEVLERAGFDFVFSGHDHTYSRTKPLLDGTPDKDGIVYMIVGAVGEKGYASENNPNFHFEVMEEDYSSVYTSVNVTYDKFEIVGRDILTNTLLDRYVKEKEVTEEHEFVIHGDRLICEDCGYNIPINKYIGFVKTQQDTYRYSINGNFSKGLVPIENEMYYFDSNGDAYTGETEVYGIRSVFDKRGKLIDGGSGFINDGNDTYYYQDLQLYQRGWIEVDSKAYYAQSGTGKLLKGENIIVGIPYNFSEDDGHLLHGTWIETSQGLAYYYIKRIRGWYEIDGYTYYFTGNEGVLTTGTTGVWQQKGRYTFNEFGQLVKGAFVEEELGLRYYIGDQNTGKNYKVGFTLVDDYLYYFDENGYAKKGTFILDGITYKADQEGKIKF